MFDTFFRPPIILTQKNTRQFQLVILLQQTKTTMTEWQPQQQGLRELLFLLGEAANPNSRDQGLINQVNNCIFYKEFFF